MSAEGTIHIPVMLEEVLAGLAPQPGQVLVDATAGGGGHLRRLAESVGPQGRVLAIDRDPAAIERLAGELPGGPAILIWGNYADLPEILAEQGLPQVAGILLDLGLSSDQLADTERGFSFNIDGTLDLRFNPQSGEPAWRLIQRLSAEHLADLIYQYGEERQSRRIARAIVDARRREPIRTARHLAEIVRGAVGARYRDRIDPATRTFQALRIAVNHELENVRLALKRFPDCLEPGGRLAVISFHSLEDRLVKEAFRDDPRWTPLTRKPLRPSDLEILRNPRSRSAKLRLAERAA
jgi:16S rRNA (cytosine1402-N4)-methyltransferase